MNKPYPEYVDLSLFNFPDPIDPKILLSLEVGKPVKLEEGLYVRRYEAYGVGRLLFFLDLNTGDTIDHNPYGPSLIWSDGSLSYYIMDKLHRIGGPADITFYESGEMDLEFYINGEYFANELDYWMEVEKLKNEASNSRQ